MKTIDKKKCSKGKKKIMFHGSTIRLIGINLSNKRAGKIEYSHNAENAYQLVSLYFKIYTHVCMCVYLH